MGIVSLVILAGVAVFTFFSTKIEAVYYTDLPSWMVFVNAAIGLLVICSVVGLIIRIQDKIKSSQSKTGVAKK